MKKDLATDRTADKDSGPKALGGASLLYWSLIPNVELLLNNQRYAAHFLKKGNIGGLGRTAHLRASFDPAFPPNATVTEKIYLAFVAAECKTNLDKTMFQEAVSTARNIRTAIPGSRYYLLCEWLDMTPISTEPTEISEAIILRGRRLGAEQRSGLADPETRRERRDWYERFLVEHPIRYDRILRFIEHLRTLFQPVKVDAGSVLERGYF